MKKVLVITITKDRLDLTRKYLKELERKGGYEFRHIVVDNASTDGSQDWLRKKGFEVIENIENEGIVKAWLRGVRMALKHGYQPDYVVKFDNDCEIATEGILGEIMRFYEENGDDYIVAPIDLEIDPAYQPHRIDDIKRIGSFRVKITGHISGMLAVVPFRAFEMMMEAGGVAKDCDRGLFWRQNGFKMAYLEDLKIHHRGINQSLPYGEYKF